MIKEKKGERKMEKISTFSFRYGDNLGHTEWYRYNENQGLEIHVFDGKMKAARCQMTEEALSRLGELVEKEGIARWDGFCELNACMCSGNSWALHITLADGTAVHAMGHSVGPEGFEEGRKAMGAFFAEYLN